MNARIPNYPVRMEDTLRVRLESEARKNSRSLNAEIVLRLTASLEAPPPASDTELLRELADARAQTIAAMAELRTMTDKLKWHQS